MSAIFKKNILLIDSQYLPCIDYYITLINGYKLKIEQYGHYQKLSYRNRCYIAGPNGMILLSVPLLHGRNQRTIMKDLRICNRDKWQSLHWKTLTSAYRRSPWFEYFEEEFRPWFEKPFEFLLDWNMEMFNLTNRLLGISPVYEFTASYEENYPPEVADLRDTLLPGKLKSAKIEEGYPKYTQVFEERTGFFPNLSILDLLFCEGKHALSLLAPA
ncbi:MAG TPA: WbqC family protein [Chitinophagaceae bacterium]